MLLSFTMARVVAFERPVDRVAEWKSWHAEQDARFARERDQKRVREGGSRMAFNRSARKSIVAVASLDMDQRETWSAPTKLIVLGSARDPDMRSSRVLLDSRTQANGSEPT
jgi:hypothetical protein